MSVSTVQSTTQTSTTSTSTSTETRKVGSLGKDDFLKLLVTQLKYQDPMNPTDDKEFIAQMAQFSSLEQMQNMNVNMSSMKAFSLMGKDISANYKDSATGEETSVNGTVQKVKVQSGKVYVEVNGTDLSIDDITDISDKSTTKITDLMNIIGKNVNATVSDGNGTEISVAGQVGGINKNSGVDYASLDGVELSSVDVVLPDGTQQYKKDYLEANVGKKVTVIAEDKSGNQIKISGTLKASTQSDDKFDVTLDDVEAQIDNITGIDN